MTSGCGTCAKVFLILFNICLFLAGLAPLVMGIIALVSESVFNEMLETIPGASVAQDLIRNSAAYLIVLGVIVYTVGLIGWFSACYSAKGLLYLYALLLLLVIGFEVAVVVIAVAAPSTLSGAGQRIMLKSLAGIHDCRLNGTTVVCPTDDVKWLGWHTLQFELNCCGAKDYTDYSGFYWVSRLNSLGNGSLAPLTCCKPTTIYHRKFPPISTSESTCYDRGIKADEYFAGGCFDAILNWLVTSALFIIVMSVIGALEVILLLSTIILMCDNSKSKVGHSDDYPRRYNNRHVRWADERY